MLVVLIAELRALCKITDFNSAKRRHRQAPARRKLFQWKRR